MSNPLPNEHEIYEKIKDGSIVIHPSILSLLEHHIGNDVYMINLIIGSTVLDGETLSVENAKKILNHCHQIKDVLNKLGKLTRPKPRNV
ncbi:MAG: hypothetical protein NT066_06735 [Candidatus Omnitrophica bacterium]|nr:hypothetical protein [Candidatus Omnitrophota bacterium]